MPGISAISKILEEWPRKTYFYKRTMHTLIPSVYILGAKPSEEMTGKGISQEGGETQER